MAHVSSPLHETRPSASTLNATSLEEYQAHTIGMPSTSLKEQQGYDLGMHRGIDVGGFMGDII